MFMNHHLLIKISQNETSRVTTSNMFMTATLAKCYDLSSRSEDSVSNPQYGTESSNYNLNCSTTTTPAPTTTPAQTTTTPAQTTTPFKQ